MKRRDFVVFYIETVVNAALARPMDLEDPVHNLADVGRQRPP